MSKQDGLISSEPTHEPGPIQSIRVRADQVKHICAIEALALHEERFRPNQLFGRDELDRVPEDQRRYGVLERLRINRRDSGAAIEDDVHLSVWRERFAEPVWKRQPGVNAARAERPGER